MTSITPSTPLGAVLSTDSENPGIIRIAGSDGTSFSADAVGQYHQVSPHLSGAHELVADQTVQSAAVSEPAADPKAGWENIVSSPNPA